MREPVTLVRVSHPTLVPLEADLIVQDQHATVYVPFSSTEEIPSFQVDERVIITWHDEQSRHSKARVLHIATETTEPPHHSPEDHQSVTHTHESSHDHSDQWHTLILSLSVEDIHANLRHYPRLLGGIDLSYTPVSEDMMVENWLEGETLEGHVFHKPLDNLMNFSVTGLKFECEMLLDESTLLLCEIGLLSETTRWRSLAKVVRVWKEDSDTSTSVAIHFISPPQDLTAALSEFTLKLQRNSEFSS